ncbi:MAG: amidase [Minwuia sp.]|uniref:amidase n=1 Tax=Minwuia sp. TaxID=2493630 RepID=UPI003A87EB76
MTEELHWMTAADLVRGYERGDFTPVEAAEAVFARIDAVDGKLNCFRELDQDRAMAAAADSAARWKAGAPLSPIDGVPTGIKDLFEVEGLRNRKGSKTTPDEPSGFDCPAVARLRAAGAVITGKTNMPEFGWKGVNDSPLTGITRNPWDTNTTPGGSSGGASAACAAGMGPLHIGTDGGGSIRIPAAFAGIVGHKAHFGRVPYYPASAMGTLAHAGPLARTVSDTLLMLNAMMGEDTHDWFSIPSPKIHGRAIEGGVKGLRIAYSPRLGYARVDEEVAASVKAAAETLAELGAEIIEVDPGFDDPADIFNVLWQSGAHGSFRHLDAARKAEMDPGLQKVLEVAEGISLGDYMDAQKARADLGTSVKLFMADYDALITPSLAVPAFEAGRLVPEDWDENASNGWIVWTPFSYPFNLTQQPACSVPCGFTKAGLPVGLQVVGRMFDDTTVLRIARAYEEANPVATSRRPEL